MAPFSKRLMTGLSIAGILLLLLFSSCRKCRECTATSWDGYEIAVEKQCVAGSDASTSLNLFEQDFRQLYSTYLVTCKDN